MLEKQRSPFYMEQPFGAVFLCIDFYKPKGGINGK
jgi:hypothetical protein